MLNIIFSTKMKRKLSIPYAFLIFKVNTQVLQGKNLIRVTLSTLQLKLFNFQLKSWKGCIIFISFFWTWPWSLSNKCTSSIHYSLTTDENFNVFCLNALMTLQISLLEIFVSFKILFKYILGIIFISRFFVNCYWTTLNLNDYVSN